MDTEPAAPNPWAPAPDFVPVGRALKLLPMPIGTPAHTPAAPGTWWRTLVQHHYPLLVAASAAFPGSASQLGRWLQCTRTWGFEKLEYHKGTATYLDFGVEMHLHAEAYLKTGLMPPTSTKPGIAAQALTGYIPAPGTVHVEGEFRYQRHTGVWYAGAIDWAAEPGVWAPADAPWAADALGVLGDHKSCADIDQYALDSAGLAADTQGLIYADRYFLKHPLRTRVGLQWTYVQKDRPRVQPVYAVAAKDSVRARMNELDYEVLAMVAARIIMSSAHQAPPEFESCGGMGFKCWNSFLCEKHTRGSEVDALLKAFYG